VKRTFKLISIILAVLLLVLLFLTYVKRKDKTIVDYYNDLPKYFFFDKDFKNLKYTLNQKKGIWVSQSLAGYKFFPTVDVKRAILKLTTRELEAAMFLLSYFCLRNQMAIP